MLDSFVMNGYLWKVKEVSQNSKYLIDRTGTLTVATTDPIKKTVYLSEDLKGDFLRKVFIHELGHCMMISFNLLEQIEKMVYPIYRVDVEEFICNLFADYGEMIFQTARDVLGDKAIHIVPYEMERFIA